MKINSSQTATDKGFSLLEMMVVIVIVSLLSTIIFQAFQFTFNVHGKVSRQLHDLDITYLREQWFRQVNSSIVRQEEVGSFHGSENGFRAVTLAPLNGEIGIPVSVEWSLVIDGSGVALWYEQGEHQVKVNYFSNSKMFFYYLDDSGNFHSSWPVKENNIYLPRGILLSDPEGRLGAFVSIENTSFKKPSEKSLFE